MARAWREADDSRPELATPLAVEAPGRQAWREADGSRPKVATPPVDRAIAAIARRQHGVISASQLADVGVAQRAISRRVAAGRLHRLHRGVYAVGHTRLGARGHWIAAVLACGDGAALCHASAAALWGIRRSDATWIDVVVPTGAGRAKRTGIRLHRVRTLRPAEVTTQDAICVTTPARTLLDLAGTLATDPLHRALDRAEILELTDYPALDAIARAHRHHRGAGPLRAAIAGYLAGTMTRSDLEDLFLSICHRHGLPRPRVNHQLDGTEVDFLFAAQRLIVEVDGWRYHRTRRAFDQDRARDAAHLTRGYRTVRLTDRQLERDETGVVTTLHSLLAA